MHTAIAATHNGRSPRPLDASRHARQQSKTNQQNLIRDPLIFQDKFADRIRGAVGAANGTEPLSPSPCRGRRPHRLD